MFVILHTFHAVPVLGQAHIFFNKFFEAALLSVLFFRPQIKFGIRPDSDVKSRLVYNSKPLQVPYKSLHLMGHLKVSGPGLFPEKEVVLEKAKQAFSNTKSCF